VQNTFQLDGTGKYLRHMPIGNVLSYDFTKVKAAVNKKMVDDEDTVLAGVTTSVKPHHTAQPHVGRSAKRAIAAESGKVIGGTLVPEAPADLNSRSTCGELRRSNIPLNEL
jgi:hypothetical protein